MWNVLSALGTVIAALIAAGVWLADHRGKARAQAAKVAVWPVILRRADDPRGDGADLDAAQGFVVRNDSEGPIWRLTITPMAGHPLPVAVLPPGTFFVYRRELAGGSGARVGVLIGPEPVFTRDDDGRLYFTQSGELATKYEVTPPRTANDDVPGLTFVDNGQRRWARRSDNLKQLRGDVPFEPLDEVGVTVSDAMTSDEAARSERRRDIGAFMREFASQCVDAAPAAQGQARPANATLAALGVVEIYLQGGTGMGVQLRTVPGHKDQPLYYVAGAVSGRVPDQFGYGPIVQGLPLRSLLPELKKPAGAADGAAGPKLADWRSPEELYDAVLAVIADNPPATTP